MKFRDLKADEVECRVATVKDSGVSLLLYKDARVDQNILDETVGPMNWQRSHQLMGDRLYCTVSIYDENKGAWVSKQDVGTESYTEKEKGQASDSFKRACFNWGIGRELYTAPFIWINGANKYDRFNVKSMKVVNGRIVELAIENAKTKTVVYRHKEQSAKEALETVTLLSQVMGVIKTRNINMDAIEKKYNVEHLSQLTDEQCSHFLAWVEQADRKAKEKN